MLVECSPLSGCRHASHERRGVVARNDAASALGMSLRHFQRHIQPCLRCVYSGQLRLYPVAELERWIDEQGWRGDAGALAGYAMGRRAQIVRLLWEEVDLKVGAVEWGSNGRRESMRPRAASCRRLD
jgi:hypothetical protein